MSTASHIYAENVTSFAPNATAQNPEGPQVGGLVDSWDDATWILTSSFIIFTMQSGQFCQKRLK
jgi:hypothetical protein